MLNGSLLIRDAAKDPTLHEALSRGNNEVITNRWLENRMWDLLKWVWYKKNNILFKILIKLVSFNKFY